jgi:hypothetical protein
MMNKTKQICPLLVETMLSTPAFALMPAPRAEPDPFAGPAIGATKAGGECDGGDVCEACQ